MNTQQIKRSGTLYAIGGAIWFLVIVGSELLGIPWSEPQTAVFTTAEIIFIIVQTLLLFGIFGVWQSGGVGDGTFGKLAFGLALFGHFVFVLVEIHSLILGELSPLFPIAPLSSAVGILLTGIAVLRAKQWQGWTRWMPFLTGIYPFLFMFPFLFIYGQPSDYAIGLWGLVRLGLGLAIRAQVETPILPASEVAR